MLGSKYRILKWAVFIVLFVSAFIGCSPKSKPSPNIIFLLTDDQRWDALGAAGNSIIQTPNLDKLARQGVFFNNSYVTTSICCSSRASILSGQYMSRHKIEGFGTSFTDSAFAETYPALLKKNGYRTGFIGKYGVGNPKDQPVNAFDFWEGANLHQPNYENYDSLGNFIHYTDIVDRSIQKFLKTSSLDQPFCLSVSFKSPHSQDGDPRQFIPKEAYASFYADEKIPRAITTSDEYWEQLPDFFRSEESISRERWKLRFETDSLFQRSVKNYYRLISGVDKVVGNIREALEEKGMSDNTIIIFTSDNGFYFGEHGLAGKWFGHNESVRVPLIVYDPQNQKMNGTTSNLMSLNIDLAPTILGMANISVPKSMQGENLLDALVKEKEIRKSFYYEHVFLGSPRMPVTTGVISDSIKYLYYPEHDFHELFDLKNDPHETENLVDNPAYRDILLATKDEFIKLKSAVN